MSFLFAKPIPLSSVERLHFFDSSPAYPNRIACRVVVEQDVNLALAQSACFWLGERHPILGCDVEEVGGRLYWNRNPDRFRADPNSPSPTAGQPAFKDCTWFHFERLDAAPSSNPNFVALLGSENLFLPCVLIRQWQPAKTNSSATGIVNEIWLSVHHAYCDGAGGIQLISDWFQIYDNLIRGREPCAGLPAIDQDRFLKRNSLGLMSWKYLRALPLQFIGLYGAAKFVFRRTLELLPDPNTASKNTSPRLTMASIWLNEQDIAQVKQASHTGRYNPNSKFLGDLFVTLENWNARRDPSANPKPWVRVILPINLREIGDRRLTAANRSSLVQVDRRNPASVAEFYRLINREIKIILRFQLDRMFLILVRLLSASDLLLMRSVQKRKPRGLAVFTNLGHPFRRIERRSNSREPSESIDRCESPLMIKELDFLAPVRYGTPLNFTLAHFQGRLRITLNYDPNVISQYEANELIESYRATICNTIS